MRAESVSIEPYGDIAVNLASFTRALEATNLSPRTIQSYTESTQLLARFLAERGMPTTVALIRREHLEAFVASLLAKWKPATAHNRYRGCQAFFRWLADEGDVAVSPFARMRPPRIALRERVTWDTRPSGVCRKGSFERERISGSRRPRPAAIRRWVLSAGREVAQAPR